MSWIDQRPDDAMDGAFMAVAPAAVSCVEPAVFREAMSRLGAAVHIVTSAGSAGKTGFTATAVCSVSDQPAMLLVCLNRRSNSAPLLTQNGVFCVNTLGATEERLADIFAGRSGVHLEQRFDEGEWTTLKTGAPILASAVVAFDCRTIEIKAVASHNVLFGVVEALRLGPSGPALVYHDRLYKPV
ncbi:MAG TPA: flavin reductase [Xanthobacteraceae bacterium]|jgi:flavin reductase (DIM6/NTAB) family NADH-FMN oxidoreductase RutF